MIWICIVCHSVCGFVSKNWIKYSDWLTIRSGHGILMYLAGQGFSVRKLSHNFPLTANSVNNQLTYKDQVLEDGIVLHFYSEELEIKEKQFRYMAHFHRENS